MSFNGSNGYFLIQKETEFGVLPTTPKTMILTNALYGESISSASEVLKSEVISNKKGTQAARNGTRSVEGDINYELSIGASDVLFHAALNSFTQTDVVVNTKNKKKKVFKRVGSIPSFLLEKNIEGGKSFTFSGMKVSNLSLEVTPEAIITGTIGLMGKSVKRNDTPFDTTPVDLPHSPYAGVDGLVMYNGQGACYESFSFSLDNQLTDSYCIGNKYRSAIGDGNGSISGEITVVYKSDVYQDNFNEEIEVPLSITFTNGDDSIEFLFPRVKITGNEPIPQFADSGLIKLNIGFDALVDKVENTDVIITVVNDFDYEAFVS